ncbi:MAG: hypothetical protein ABT27_23320 [Lysobacteraceae bacterium SCN 69-25]|nr:MAG: hypothetical protein ABT27_23320 [Xanthomonadaceae bacterium SCN 69-25]
MLPWLLILPSLALAGAVIGYPFYEIIRLSLSEVSRFGQVRGFAGLANFQRIATDPIFIDALVRTIPDGVVLTALKQEGETLTLEFTALRTINVENFGGAGPGGSGNNLHGNPNE